MRTLLPQLRRWIDRGDQFALATVVHVEGSVPRAPGECLIIAADGLHFAGAVSSGCLENEVLETAAGVLATGVAVHLRFGPDGNFPWQDGLSCGGYSEVRVEPWWGCSSREQIRPIGNLVLDCLERDIGCLVLTHGDNHFALAADGRCEGDRDAFDPALLETAVSRKRAGGDSRRTGEGDAAVFVRMIHPRRTLLMVGAVDLAVRMTPLAMAAGFRTVVLDPRRAYASVDRFEAEPPDQFLCGWPEALIGGMKLGARDAAVVLSHDPKIDDPALLALLRSKVGYIGALGSKVSHERRLVRMREQGADDVSLARIEGPAGIKLGVDASAVAMGIMAGVVRGCSRGHVQ